MQLEFGVREVIQFSATTLTVTPCCFCASISLLSLSFCLSYSHGRFAFSHFGFSNVSIKTNADEKFCWQFVFVEGRPIGRCCISLSLEVLSKVLIVSEICINGKVSFQLFAISKCTKVLKVKIYNIRICTYMHIIACTYVCIYVDTYIHVLMHVHTCSYSSSVKSKFNRKLN